MTEESPKRAGGRPTEARIDLAAVRANYATARACAQGRDVIAVVKADAYGHGVVPIVRALAGAGGRRFAVATVEEGVALRAAFPDLAILVLGGLPSPGEAREAAAHGLVPVLHDEAQRAHAAAAAAAQGRPLEVHVEVDTGMRRLGVPEAEAADLLEAVADAPALRLGGVLTHLACADDPEPDASLAQLARFREVLAAALERGVAPGLVHVANSAALLSFARLDAALPEADAVRPGLMLYGVSPAPHFAAELLPVMTLRTEIVALRPAAPGDTVGYGASHRVTRATRVATVPAGYADGVPWTLGNRGSALLRGRRVPYAGRVSMDLVTLDVGDLRAEVGDEVILFGVGEGGLLRVEELAEVAGTLSYELLVRVGQRVPRRVVGESPWGSAQASAAPETAF